MKLDAKNRKRYADRFRYFASNMAMYFLPDRMADIPWRRIPGSPTRRWRT
jgi:hypothetical protein